VAIVEGPPAHADVCIVGSGPAGLILGEALTAAGARVAVLERGGRQADADAQRLIEVETPWRAIGRPSRIRRFAVGGAGWMWGRAAIELEPTDFEPQPTAPHVSWPFGADELADHYSRARGVLDVKVPDLVPEAAPSGFVLRPRSLSGRRLGAEAETTSVPVHPRITVTRIVPGAGGKSVDRLDAVNGDGRSVAITADRYVLAAGGIENARLLLASNVGGGPVGAFYADHPHLTVPIESSDGWGPFDPVAIQPGHTRLAEGVMVATGRGRRAEGLLDAHAYLIHWRRPDLWDRDGVLAWLDLAWALRNRDAPAGAPLVYWRALAGVPELLRAVGDARRHPRRMALRVGLESPADPANRVTLSERRDRFGVPMARVEWRVGEPERASFDRYLADLASAASAEGWGPVRYPLGSGWPDRIEGAAHHMGTTRMHVDPAQGVVDANCRVHGFDDLFVAGSSVFPTYGYANPTLTIVALALRLADHLRS
jgi:choline dehydrogenase-like flavoprotein